jgi:hypothetical protein
MNQFPTLALLSLALSPTVLLGACGSPEPADDPAVAATSVALVTADKFFTDATGDLTIVVRTCDFPASFTTGPRCAYCAVDQGWTMIGGGAEIQLQNTSATDARLRGSFPFPHTLTGNGTGAVSLNSPDGNDQNCTGNADVAQDPNTSFVAWMARSGGASSHKLRAYVVGLRINGLAASELGVTYKDTVSDTQARVHVIDGIVDRGLTIGGGADVVGSKFTGYLTESRLNETSWTWRGAEYDPSQAASLKVYAIGIDLERVPANWDIGYLQMSSRSVTTGPVSTGTGTASASTPFPSVLASIGATGVTHDPRSRYLTGLVPLSGSNQGFSVKTKDQGTTAGGTTTGYSMNLIGGRWGTWLHNAIRFTSAGTTLLRPSGTAPVRLQQANTVPQPWHLEDIGGGSFRIRTGNPSRPEQGECVFRQSSTGNPVVGPCMTGSSYNWTILDDLRGGRFQLRNLASGTCLDNGNATGTVNLTLKTCTSGSSPSQEFFLDTNSWP